MGRGFGITANTDTTVAANIARLVEEWGYSTIWTNDSVTSGDGIEVAAAMGKATSSIRIGIGVIPIDARPPALLALLVKETEIPFDRMVVGIGAGFSERPVAAVRAAVAELRRLLGAGAKIGVAAMGPKMCAAGGQIADLVLLNWMTPDRIRWARQIINRAGSPEVAAYIRSALGPNAAEVIAQEAGRYSMLPHYRRHFEAMGIQPGDVGIAIEDPSFAGDLLRPYEEVLDEAVVRALSGSPEEALEIARIAAP